MSIPLVSPFIKRRDMDAVLTALIADNVVPGTQVAELCSQFASECSADACRAFREYPRACQAALGALDLAPGTRVGLSALAPRMWERCILDAGLVPVPVDVHPTNPTLDPAAIAKECELAGLGAVIATHALGYLCDMAALLGMGIPVIEDMSQAYGIGSAAYRAGSGGQLVVCALENDGIITSGGGCMVGTRTRKETVALDRWLDSMDHGVIMGDVNAALARAQMTEAPAFLDRRRELRKAFESAALKGRHRLPSPLGEGEEALAFFALLVQGGGSDIIQYARKKNIEVQAAFQSSLLHDWTEEDDPRRFPHAYAMLLRCLLFPLHPGIRTKDLEVMERVLATLP